MGLLLLFFDLLGCPLLIRRLLLLANGGEFELLHGDPLDIPELVEVHGAEGEYLIVLLDLLVETEATGYLEEGLVVVRQEVGPVLLLPLGDGALRDALPLRKLDVRDPDVVLQEADHRERDVIEDLPDTLLVHYLNY